MGSRLRIVCVFLFFCHFGCAGVGPGGDPSKSFDGNPATRPTPGFTELEIRPATSTSPSGGNQALKSLALMDNVTEVEEVRFFTRDLQLIGAAGPAFTLPGPFVVRLVQEGLIVDQALPNFGGAVVPNGAYARLQIGFEILTADNRPPDTDPDPVVTELLDHSMIVTGSFLGPQIQPILGIRIPFRFVSRQTSTLAVETPNDLILDGDYLTLFLAFKIQTWIDQGVLDAIFALDPLLLLADRLELDTESENPLLKTIALELEANINASLRLAPSTDDIFQESDVDEESFSNVIAL